MFHDIISQSNINESNRNKKTATEEFCSNLDFGIGRHVLEIMEAMTGKEQNRTVLIATHNPAIRALGDRVVRISDGKIVENYTQKFTPAKELYW